MRCSRVRVLHRGQHAWQEARLFNPATQEYVEINDLSMKTKTRPFNTNVKRCEDSRGPHDHNKEDPDINQQLSKKNHGEGVDQ